MADANRHARMWMGKLDALAAQANADLESAAKRTEHQSDHGIGQALVAIASIGQALVAIASQLAYGNAVAAASFYMANRLWITPDEEAT